MVRELQSAPEAFRSFAATHPQAAQWAELEEPAAEELIERFGAFAAVLAAWKLRCVDGVCACVVEAACDEIEQLRVAHEESAPEQEGDADVEVPAALREELASAQALVEALRAELAASRRESEERVRELKQLRRDLRVRTQEVARKDRKAQTDATQIAELTAALEERERALGQVRAERDEYARQAKKLERRARSDKNGIQTIEDKRSRENQEQRKTIDGLQERLAVAAELERALSTRVDSLEGKLADERQQRAELEEAFSAFGMDDLLGDAHSFGQAVDALVRFRDSVSAYATRQREREVARELAEREAELEQQRAEAARRASEEAHQAWEQQERDRISELEAELFGGDPDHVIIDGHNLVHRVYRPEDEARTRPWLERMIVRVAERLEAQGRDLRFHLVFDTQHGSNSRGAGHGVDIHFQNNATEGGADAKIGELLDEGNPAARYMVVSTDRKHVWADASGRIDGDGLEIDLVQIELLANYLQALDHSERQAPPV